MACGNAKCSMIAKIDNKPFDVEVFFDGDCPLCKREIAMLQRMDKQEKIRFTDIAAAEFDEATCGKTYDQLMAEIHARLPNGQWIKGVEVFRRLYGAVGFRWLVALTRLPLLSQLLDLGYWGFAKNRLRFTGRCAADGAACKVKK